MYIRRYGDRPGLYVPDVGEVVEAARSTVGPYARAAIVSVKRSAENMIRVDWVWLEDSPRDCPYENFSAGEKGHAQLSVDGVNRGAVRRISVRNPLHPQGE